MTIPTFEEQREAWSHPPVDDIGYISSANLLALSDDDLHALVERMEHTRYSGWRNHGGHWRHMFKLDVPGDGLVLDYGCGVGVESLQYAKMGYRVILADIAVDNVTLAERVLNLYGYEAHATAVVTADAELVFDREDQALSSVDVIHCVGVLHHIPDPHPIFLSTAPT